MPPKGGKTFRLRGVPLHWSTGDVRSFLEDHYRLAAPIVKSLAPEIDAKSSTATVAFGNVALPGPTRRILLPEPPEDRPSRDQYVILDDNFYGITTLFAPPPEDHKVDVVAISGLGGHAFGSFKERDENYMWLRDALPFDLTRDDTDRPIARVMIYGYESAVAQSRSIQNLSDLASSFYNSIRALANASTVRPIILVAHSLGGLIIKQTIMALSKSKKEDDRQLTKAVYGIVFFGVPHDGMDTSSLIPMVGDSPNRPLVDSLSHINSLILNIQQQEFHTALGSEGDSEIVCFYETVESPTAVQGVDGKWSMTGPPITLVTKSSATHCRPWENGPEHVCAVARTHSDMVKFGPQDHEYDKVRERLKGLAKRASVAQRRIQGSNVKFLVPYNCNLDFVGRSEILKSLEQQLGHSRRQGAIKPRPRVALHGLGGIGKTQIALAYVYRLRETCPEVSVFWVHASSAERFRQSYASIAQECQVPSYDDPKMDMLLIVKKWLERKDCGKWLMVIDNADDTQVFFSQPAEPTNTGISNPDSNLARYLPECAHGVILTTTRNKQTGSRLTYGKGFIDVGRMDEDESDQLLRAALNGVSTTSVELSALSSRLEYLPLALVQATAFMQENTISVGDYLQLLNKSDQNLVDLLSGEFETVGRDSGTPRAVAETWILSFEQIQQQDAFTGEILSLMSLFDRQAIPSKFLYNKLQQGGEPTTEIQLTKALGVLKAFSFVTEDKDHKLDMHRLVQLVTRKWLVNKGTMQRFTGQALLAVSQAYPYGNYENRTVCGAYLPHAYAVLESGDTGLKDERAARASLLHCVAGFFSYQGRWKDAEKFQFKAVKWRKEVLGDKHPSTLSSIANLASTYRNQGRWKEAETLEVQVMEMRKKVLGDEHPSTLTSMNNLASTYWNQGRWKEAETLEVQVMEMYKKVLGDEHPDTLTSIANLASTYRNQGRWKEAETLEVQVMEMRKKVLGDEHPSTLTSMNNLASTYWNQGRWKEAETLEVQVMEMYKKVLGDEHPDTLTSIANLASTYRNQGRWKEAETLEVQVMEMYKKVLGDEHPDTLSSIANLASTYRNQGRWKEAETLEVQVMEMRKKVLGDEHPDTLTSMNNLASTYWNQGRWKEAETLEVQVMEMYKKVLGDEHPSTLTSIANLASTYWNQGRWKEAETLEVQVMEMYKKVLGDEHPSTLTSIANLASTYRNQGRWKEAETLQVQVMEMRKKVLGDEHPDTLTSMNNLAYTWKSQGQGRFDDALTLLQNCLHLQQQILGPDHPNTISTRSTLASWAKEVI
ncbi:hypothetical protein B0H67DRAFT_641836 [Lasiosphaeris hirsuta]|uniref:DUF7779 domain-containing protein n=1 Tax=Lasiosphaeris hirsuta TaxID=260670 RepID=A0AA40B0H3_9PEZI|nr:hypothetical protein B0H67DRAFT_641836 [Lasiosphaeris hirsuta]